MNIFNQFIGSATRQIGRNVANDVYYKNRQTTYKKSNAKAWAILIIIGFIMLIAYAIENSANANTQSLNKDTIKVEKHNIERIIHHGKRGGKYYYNEKGKKVYIK